MDGPLLRGSQRVRFSELAGKEIIDIHDGIRLGVLGEADVLFEARTGRVRAIVITEKGSWWQRGRERVIPWRGVRKIGVDLIIVDLSTAIDRAELAMEEERGEEETGVEPFEADPGEGRRRPRSSGSVFFPREG